MSRFLDPAEQDVNVGNADKVYHADLTVDRPILDQGELATIFGIQVANSSGTAAEVTFRDSSGGVRYTATAQPRTSQPFPVRFATGDGFIAEALTGAQADDVFVSVFYTGGIV